MHLRSPFIVLGAFIASGFVGWLATQIPIPFVISILVLISGLLITKVRDLWLVLFVIGVHFDDLFIPLGFAKVGYGDFALGLLLGYWVFWQSNRKLSLQLPQYWSLLLFYVVGTGLSWLQGPAPELITGLFIRNCMYVLGFFALVDLIREERQINLILWVTMLSILFHVLIGFYLDTGERRFEGLVAQPNYFGGLIGPGAIIALLYGSSTNYNGIIKVLLCGIGGLIAFGLVLTVSRGSQLAFIAAIFWACRKRWRLILFGLFIALLIFQLIIILEADRLDYFFKRWQLKDGSVIDRQAILLNALRVIYEHPIFGIGFSQFTMLQDVMSIDSVHGRASHNHYLGEAATLGLPTVTMLFGFIAYQAKRLLQLDRFVEQRTQITVLVLQSLFIFQSVALIFRGGRRMIEWTFLAVYTATLIIYHKKYQAAVS